MRGPTIRQRDERGSMAVEMVLLAPVLMMFIMLVVAFGRYVSLQGDVDAAARDAARAASLATSQEAAASAARATVAASLDGDTTCTVVDPQFGDWVAGGEVRVRLLCSVSMSDLGLIGVRKVVDVDSTSAVPLDPYRNYG